MKTFEKLFVKPSPQYFQRIKFNPVKPLLLPLAASQLFTTSNMNTQSWHIDQISGSMSVFFAHLIPPQNNRVNTRFNLDKYIGQGVEESVLQKTLHCRPQNPRSSLEHLLIGLHDNHVISLMAIPKTGANLKLCQALSGTQELPDLSLLDNIDLANKFSYQFAAKAGADPRARACLVVRCDNTQDIARVDAFLKGIHSFSPFDSTLMTLINDLIVQSEERISLAAKIDELIKEKNEFVIPEHVIGASYSKKIKDRISGIMDEVGILKKQTIWQISNTIQKKSKLNLFAGYPNDIPDLQKNTKEILTYNPRLVNDLSAKTSDIFISILSGDYELFEKIVIHNPLVIYERDCHGYLPIEVAYQAMQIRMGVDLYTIWTELPKSQQWSSQIFFETANRFTHLEYCYGLVLDDTQKERHVRDFFSDELPLLEQPLAVYKAITQEDALNLSLLVGQETSKWVELQQLCLNGNVVAARRLFAEFLPKKYAVFSASLNDCWLEIMEAIEDYFPNIIGLDQAIDDGDWEIIEILRKEPILRDWKKLQDAIDKTRLVPEIRKQINKTMEQINSLEDPIVKDRAELQHLNQNLIKLHEEIAQQLLEYKAVRKEITSAQWEITEQNNSFKYLQWLKEKIRHATQGQSDQASLKIGTELVGQEVKQFHDLLHALKEKDASTLREFGKNECERPSPLVAYFKSKIRYQRIGVTSESLADLDLSFMPEHFALYDALFNNDITSAYDYIENYLQQKKTVLVHIENIAKAKEYLSSRIAKRSAIHECVIRGESLPIDKFIVEKNDFDQYTTYIKNVLQAQCLSLQELMGSICLEPLNPVFEKTVSQNILVKQSLVELVNKYINVLVLDDEAMAAMTKEFEFEYDLFNNPELEKTLLLNVWHKIQAIKLHGIHTLNQLTKDYRKRALCQDERIFRFIF